MNLLDAFFNTSIVRKFNEMRYIKSCQLKFDAEDELESWKKFGKIARYDYLCEFENMSKNASVEDYKKYCIDILKKCMRKKKVKSEIEQFVVLCCEKKVDDAFEKCYEKAIIAMNDIKADELHICDWNMLEYLFLYFRTSRMAYICRKNKNELLIRKPIKRNNPGYARWYALLENGMKKEAKMEMDNILLSSSKKEVGRVEYAAYLSDLLTGNDAEKSKERLLNVLPENDVTKSFREYVKDKYILVVGPAFEKKEGVDNAVIVRFNEVNPIDVTSASYPFPTDVSYYRSFLSRDVLAGKATGCHLKYRVVRESGNLDYSIIKNTRPLFICDFLFPNGTANNVPNVILDMIRFDVKGVKITGSNLFIAKQLHEKNYADPRMDEKSYVHAIHNLTEQFVFMKIAAEAGLYEPDNILQAVIDMTPEEYAAKLETDSFFGL